MTFLVVCWVALAVLVLRAAWQDMQRVERFEDVDDLVARRRSIEELARIARARDVEARR